MKFNSEMGKIYDSIFFFYDYYSDSKTLKECTHDYGDTEFMAHCLNQIRNDIKPPEILRPLFKTVRIQINPITTFFSNHFNFVKDDFESFVIKLSNNTDKIFQMIIDNIFEGYQKMNSVKISPSENPEEYLQALQNLNADADFKLQLSLFISNFDYAMSVFIDLFKRVYHYVSALHDKYQREITAEYERVQNDDIAKLYENFIEADIFSAPVTEITICILNQYIVYTSKPDLDSLCLMIGVRSTQIIEDEKKFSSISINNFLIACGNETRFNALQSIADYGELTLSQLAKLQNVSPATMLRHIEVLLGYHLIQVSRRDGLQIFYKINAQMFRSIKPDLDIFIQTMESSKGVLVK